MYKPMANLREFMQFLKDSKGLRGIRVNFFDRRAGKWSKSYFDASKPSVRKRMQMERFRWYG